MDGSRKKLGGKPNIVSLKLFSLMFCLNYSYKNFISDFPNTSIKGGGTGRARGAIAPPLFTDHFKIFYLITVTQKIVIDISDTKIGLE